MPKQNENRDRIRQRKRERYTETETERFNTVFFCTHTGVSACVHVCVRERVF